MFKYVKNLGESFIGWLCVSTAIGIGMEAGKDLYYNFKKKKTNNSNEEAQ